MFLVQFNYLGLALGKDLQILHKCGKKVENKGLSVLRANSYVCRSCKGKIGKKSLFAPPPPYLNRVKIEFPADTL